MELDYDRIGTLSTQVRIHLLMNHIGTHDTERILTVLGGEPLNGRDREWQSRTKLSQEQRSRGLSLFKAGLAYAIHLARYSLRLLWR